MKTMKALGGGLGLAALALASSVAQAQSSESFGEVTGNIGFASEYVFRGLPSSNGGAQVSGGLDWSKDQFYVGGWMSNVGSQNSGNEVDLYAGVNLGDFDLGVIGYAFPGAPDARQTKLFEAYAGYTKGMLSGYVYYGLGNEFRGNDDDYVYLDGSVSGAISEKVELTAHLGYTIYTGEQTADDALDLGLTLNMGNFWVGATTIVQNDTNGGAFKRPRLNLGYTWTFDNVMDIYLNSFK